MKKLFPILTLCMGLCFVSCYDDSELVERIDALEQSTIASLKASISSLETQSKEIKASIASLEQSGNANAADISNLKTSLSTIEAKIAELKDWVEKLLEGYYSKDEIDAQISSLNTELETLRTSISSIESKLAILTREFSITFDDADIGILAGGTASVGYSIIGATDKTTVKALGQNGWSAKVTPDGADKGTITVTAPNPLTEDEIIVLVYDGEYRTIMSSINFVIGVVSPSQTAYELNSEAGTIDIPISTNINYSISVPDTAKDWLSVIETKSMREDIVTFTYTENTGYMRSCSVDFIDKNGIKGASISFIQKKAIVQADAVDLSAHGTANCYIISEEGWYKFNIGVKGNSLESVGNVASISIIWESYGTEVAPTVGDLIQEVKLVEDYAYVRTPNILKEGNALVAVKDMDNNILWSWHLWITDKPQNIVYANNAGIMMDRNLGATSAEIGSSSTIGLLYQWGRKDPFMGSALITPDPTAPSYTPNGIPASSTIVWPKAVKCQTGIDEINGTIDFATKNPTTFITAKNGYMSDWYYYDDEIKDNRWQSEKTIYDPCPVGWRVPDGGESGIYGKAGFPCGNYSHEADVVNRGHLFTSDYCIPETWYPLTGVKSYSDGDINYMNQGSYWSCLKASGLYKGEAYYFVLNDDFGISYSEYYGRANGYAVRCQLIE